MSRKFALVFLVLLIAASLYAAVTSDIAPKARTKQPIPEIIIPMAPPMKMGPKVWHLQEGFEGSWLPAGWDTARVSGTYAGYLSQVTAGTYPTCTPHGGSYMVKYYSYLAPDGDRIRLITTPVNISGANDSLSFWMVHDPGYVGYTERIVIEIMTKPSGGSWGAWAGVDSFYRYQATQAWLYHALPLGAYVSDSVRISFTGHSNYGNNMYLDDVAIGSAFTPTTLDMTVQSIDTPATVIVPPSVPFHGVWTIKNLGTSPASDFVTHYEIYDSTGATTLYGPSASITSPDSLAPDSSRQFTALTDFTPDPATLYRVKAFTELSGDGHPENDTARFTFRTYELLTGTVTDDNNAGAPLPNVIVTAAGPATYVDTTDVTGGYSFPSMSDGSYTLTARLDGYTTETVPGVAIVQVAPTVANIAMGYPVLSCTPSDSFYITMPVNDTDNTTWGLAINNTGTRDLNYSLTWPPLTKGGRAFGDSLYGLANLDAITGSPLSLGVEYAQGSIWTTNSGANSTADANYLVQMDATGSVLATYTQPAAGNTGFGWRDLCFDGTYLYGSYSGVIDQIDPSTGAVTGITIPSPQNPGRALAYNPSNDHFYVANFGSSIYEIDRTGAIINTWANTLTIYGLAFDGNNPAGPSLWAWSQDGSPQVTATRFDLTTGVYGTETFIGHGVTGTTLAGGVTFTTELVPGKAVLLCLYQDAADRLVGHEIRDDNVSWLNFAPASGTVTAGNTGNCVVTFNTTGLADLTTYAALLNVKGNFTAATTPAYLHTNNATGVAGNHGTSPTAVFALLPNSPNPARGRTTFNFSLPKAGDYSLKVYNIAGQLVHSFAGAGAIGRNSVAWNAGQTANGVYFYTLSAGGQNATRKLVMIK